MKRILFTVLVALGASFAASCESPPTPVEYHNTMRDKQAVVYLVRHAEKETGDNPHLTNAGKARADLLAEYLSAEPVTEVWSTDFNRTRETAAPVAQAHGLEVQLYEPMHTYRMADRLREKTGVVVVIGHSNTIGKIASEMIHEDPDADLNESDYETLYWVTVAQDGHTQMYQSSYEGLKRRVTE